MNQSQRAKNPPRCLNLWDTNARVQREEKGSPPNQVALITLILAPLERAEQRRNAKNVQQKVVMDV